NVIGKDRIEPTTAAARAGTSRLVSCRTERPVRGASRIAARPASIDASAQLYAATRLGDKPRVEAAIGSSAMALVARPKAVNRYRVARATVSATDIPNSSRRSRPTRTPSTVTPYLGRDEPTTTTCLGYLRETAAWRLIHTPIVASSRAKG